MAAWAAGVSWRGRERLAADAQEQRAQQTSLLTGEPIKPATALTNQRCVMRGAHTKLRF
jgi:hypothetical protein